MSLGSRSWSLKRRLATRLLVVLAIAVLGPPIAFLFFSWWTVGSLHHRALQDQAADIVRGLDTRVTPPVLTLPEVLAAAYTRSNDSYFYLVLERDGTVVTASSPLAASLATNATIVPPGEFFLVPRAGGAPWYTYSTNADGYRIVVAQDSSHENVLFDSIVREVAGFTLWLALPLLLVALLVMMHTLNRAFRPIARAAEDARTITPGGQEAQISAHGLPREITPLVKAVNAALARLARAYDVERRFTTDAAHELRTPVAVLMARIDMLPEGPAKESLVLDTARLSRSVSQLLQVARLDAKPLAIDEDIDLARVVRHAVALLGPLAMQDGRRMEMTAPNRPIMVRGNAQAIALAVTNLVENALSHTPAGTPIDVQVTSEPAIYVLDRGQGVPPDERMAIFERFQRSPNTASSGTGLGLAIVAEIAARHHAVASVEARAGGGSIFAIRWINSA
ncbi:integral membrane sensor signal transduction histidine kinase [Ancylobacter novellus DSM 506]|uniref:histidine kinase n=1 Tax=Ancylobacter novellus (strain ATCC 8093 / DSM 506 / JCM 20403 / CCM 1077 / IAM 12100 / NBRC 12443 / NCIMB 10456) TaxID=639283 RepID=D7A475_ANCN5|nr:HAMP domain-containing sensor histidine kinase [Ancylobacter novellus]ADH87895.1 integral membrane sensor signal transduction histidine kinase [Ancylobacter novellus DSM 506]